MKRSLNKLETNKEIENNSKRSTRIYLENGPNRDDDELTPLKNHDSNYPDMEKGYISDFFTMMGRITKGWGFPQSTVETDTEAPIGVTDTESISTNKISSPKPKPKGNKHAAEQSTSAGIFNKHAAEQSTSAGIFKVSEIIATKAGTFTATLIQDNKNQDDVEILNVISLNKYQDKSALLDTQIQSLVAQRTRAISSVDSEKSFSSMTCLRKKNTHRLGSVAKKKSDKKSLSAKRMSEKYIPSFKEGAAKGFSGSKKDYTGIAELILLIERDKKKEAITDMERKTEPNSRLSIKTKTTLAPWLKDMQDAIARIVSGRPSSPLPDKVETKLYDEILAQEALPILRVKKSPTQGLLFPALSQSDLQKVAEMQSGDGLVVKNFKIPIQKSDLRTLKGSSWLNDEIINFYGELCMDRAKLIPDKYPKIHCFNTFFYLKIKEDGYERVRRWTKKIDIFALDYVIIPVHRTAHWCCAVINFKLKRFEYYDSLHGSDAGCLKDLRDYLASESLDKKKAEYDLTTWSNYIPKDCPNQENSYDCGVFTCMFMEWTARTMDNDVIFNFNQSHMPYLRKRIAVEIINSKLLWF